MGNVPTLLPPLSVAIPRSPSPTLSSPSHSPLPSPRSPVQYDPTTPRGGIHKPQQPQEGKDREREKRLVPNWLLSNESVESRRMLPHTQWKGTYPQTRDDDSTYPHLPPPPSPHHTYPKSTHRSPPHHILAPIGKPTEYAAPSFYPSRNPYKENYQAPYAPAPNYRPQHDPRYSYYDEYNSHEYCTEQRSYRPSEKPSSSRAPLPPPPPPPLPRRDIPLYPLARQQDPFREAHFSPSLPTFPEHATARRDTYYLPHADTRVPVHLLQGEVPQDVLRTERRYRAEWDLRRAEFELEMAERRKDEYLGTRRSELNRSELGRHADPHFPQERVHAVPRASVSPQSPAVSPSASPSGAAPGAPFTARDPYAHENVTKFRRTSVEHSRTPSPHSDSHLVPTTSPLTPPTPTGPPSPIFTMENFGPDGGKQNFPHPKNPVKFEFKDFKENEYHLHNLQNSAGGSTLLSLKQQKRHKRIINRALAQGQARARAMAQEGVKTEEKKSPETAEETELDGPQKKKKKVAASAEKVPESTTEEVQEPKKRRDTEEPEQKLKSLKRKAREEAKSEEKAEEKNSESLEHYDEDLHNTAQSPKLTRSSTRIRAKASGALHCICKKPETNSMVQCDLCDKWYHFECVKLTEAMAQEIVHYNCNECVGTKARSEDVIEEADEPTKTTEAAEELTYISPPHSPKEPIAETTDDDTLDSDEGAGIQVGDSVISISGLAKQPWLDGWATARTLAVRYLKEAKKLGHEITENRRLPKQIAVRMSGKGKRAWRQAEVLLAIQFLKTSDLVETSTKKGTLVREPCKTMDDLIARAQTIAMPNRSIGKLKVVEFTRPRPGESKEELQA